MNDITNEELRAALQARTFDAARKAQGFQSAAHLAAFFALYDHTESCGDCKSRDGWVALDDGYQPTKGRCPETRRLDAAVSAVSR